MKGPLSDKCFNGSERAALGVVAAEQDPIVSEAVQKEARALLLSMGAPQFETGRAFAYEIGVPHGQELFYVELLNSSGLFVYAKDACEQDIKIEERNVHAEVAITEFVVKVGPGLKGGALKRKSHDELVNLALSFLKKEFRNPVIGPTNRVIIEVTAIGKGYVFPNRDIWEKLTLRLGVVQPSSPLAQEGYKRDQSRKRGADSSPSPTPVVDHWNIVMMLDGKYAARKGEVEPAEGFYKALDRAQLQTYLDSLSARLFATLEKAIDKP